VDEPLSACCEVEGCGAEFTGYTSSQLRRRIEPEEFVRNRRASGKPVLCLRHLREEQRKEAGL
jgi:hypothetical protein